MKRCPSCNRDLEPTDFYTDNRRMDKKTVYCKLCQTAKKQAYHATPEGSAKRRERNKLSMQQFRLDPVKAEKLREYTRQYRALARGAIQGVTKADLVALMASTGGCCWYCGDPLAKPAFDHVMPVSLGGSHAIENLVPCCQPCNSAKGQKTLDQFQQYVVAIAEAVASIGSNPNKPYYRPKRSV